MISEIKHADGYTDLNDTPIMHLFMEGTHDDNLGHPSTLR